MYDGEIAAVALDNEVTLKHVRRLRGPDGNVVFTQLLPSNPAYSPIDIGGEDETRMCACWQGRRRAVHAVIFSVFESRLMKGGILFLSS